MSTVLTIGGDVIAVPQAVLLDRLVPYARGSYPTLSFLARGEALPGLPDPYLGKPVTLTIDSELVFAGDVVQGPIPARDDRYGWVLSYQAVGLRARLDWLPHTDEVTGTDTSPFNLTRDTGGTDYIAARAGRTIGQILTSVLTMPTNATLLDGLGLINYTSLSPPTLPTSTQDDLDALTFIPPCPVYFQGEKLGSAIEAVISGWCKNHWLHVEPDGTLRVLDQRDTTEHVFTLDDDDPVVEASNLSRSVADCFQRVVIRGAPLARGVLLSLAAGDLAEDFAWGPYNNSQAKTNWTPEDFTQPGLAESGPNVDEGAANCLSTTSVRVTSDNTSRTWDSNYWDQTSNGRHGVIYLREDGNPNITQFAVRRVIANTALTAAGTSDLTLDEPLPHTDYDSYKLFGFSGDAALVWRRYEVVNTAVAAALANFFSYPQAFRLAAGNGAMLTSAPIGSVVFDGLSEVTLAFEADPDSGAILFAQPTWIVAGNQAPDDVRALVGVYDAAGLRAIFPPNSGETPQYAGTSHVIEGLTKTLALTLPNWRDPAGRAQVEAWAADVLDSVKDTIVEGTVRVIGLYSAALAPGLAVSVEGAGFATGWEDLALPVVECEVTWSEGHGSHWITTLTCSNRRAALSSDAFLAPERTGFALGIDTATLDPRDVLPQTPTPTQQPTEMD